MTIQEQLRPIALGDDVGDLPGLALDACDRIDVLEAALREIIEGDQRRVGAEPIDPNDRRGHWRDVIKDGKSAKIARAALESTP